MEMFKLLTAMGMIACIVWLTNQKAIKENEETQSRNKIYENQCNETCESTQRKIDALNRDLEDYRKEWE